MANDPIVCLKDVSFGYDRELVLEGANLDVHRGDLMSIVGPNGSGKSTLLKLILGAVRPTAGDVRVLGQAPEHVRHRIGYMPQALHYDPQFPVTVRDVVLMGRLGTRSTGRYRKSDRIAAMAAMERVRVADLASRSFAALSGGQRQRVLIARALACEPELLLLDEPTANVDAAVESRFYETLADLKSRMTILMVSHDLRFVSSLVDQVICVSRRVEVHPTGEITSDVIRNLYGSDLRLVRHDHRHPASEHAHG